MRKFAPGPRTVPAWSADIVDIVKKRVIVGSGRGRHEFVMPLQYQIDTSHSLIHLIAADPLTFAEWQAIISAVLADPRFKPGFAFISDRRRVLTDKSMEDLPKMAGFLRLHARELGRCRWAVVVPADAKVARGWAVVASELVDGSTEIEPAVFTDIDAAIAWATNTSDVRSQVPDR